MQLEGKVATITGGTRGIGRGIADAFLAEGANVVVNGRNPDKGAQAQKEMGGGDNVTFIAGDVTQQADVERLIDETVGRYGRIDILVNNAGGGSDFAPCVDLTDEAWNLGITWNLHATFWGMRRALRSMIPQQWGRIINISSVEGKHGKPAMSPYVAAKHAINGLTKSVAKEVGTLGITVNALCPGLIITDIVRENGPQTAEAMGLTFDEMVDLFAQESAIKRTNTVEEVAAMAVLLASDVGAGITGAMLSIDGGTAAY
jgi:3-hydroxybutyrate dehydrogenase/3-oxoacyl-[acyl-carrier protein] reductase